MTINRTILATLLTCLSYASQMQADEVTCWNVKGEQITLTTNGSFLKIPFDVAAIDLRTIGFVHLDRFEANPNCLYYIASATDVEGLPNANVVCDGVCDGLLLTDTANFFCPIAFSATDAMLRLTPRRDDGGDENDFTKPCNETVFLPFDSDLVMPADANGPMPDGWFKAALYSGFLDNQLIFSQTSNMPLCAYTPYLVRFAYGAYGTQILFCGQNKTIRKTETTHIDSNKSGFVGTTISESESDNYFRYHRGGFSYFIHTGDGKPMEPFRCFMVSSMFITEENEETDKSEGRVLEYTVFETDAGSVDCVTHYRGQASSPQWHDLMGKAFRRGRVRKGLYITGGTKVLIK